MRILIILLLLAGCATPPDAVVPPKEQTVQLDSSVYEECKPLLRLEKGADHDGILKVTTDNAELFAQCARKQKDSIAIIRKFSNKKE